MNLLINKLNTKVMFCLVIITLLTAFFFFRSVQLRERWMTLRPQAMSGWGQPARMILFTNNWLKEGPLQLRFTMYKYLASVEMSTLDRRGMYASFGPGAVIPLYFLFKLLDVTGVVTDIHAKPNIQLLLLIYYNYLVHFLLALTLCFMVLFVCSKSGFDLINSVILAIIPSVVQFHNTTSLYFHHFYYGFHSAVLLPYVLYIFLELVRAFNNFARGILIISFLQSILIFYGVLTDWVFIFVILTVYLFRVYRKEIVLPVKMQQLRWVKQSILFFTPALVAISFYLYQIYHYASNVANSNIFAAKVSNSQVSLPIKFLQRMGVYQGNFYGSDTYLNYLKNGLFTRIHDNHGSIGLVIIYATFLVAISYTFMRKNGQNKLKIVHTACLLLFIPCFANLLIFIQNYSLMDHPYLTLIFSIHISIGCAFLPMFILHTKRVNIMQPFVSFTNSSKSIMLATALGVLLSITYGFSQIGGKDPFDKYLNGKADFRVENFIRKNTAYQDVVFSSNYRIADNDKMRRVYSNKVIYTYNDIRDIYEKINHIKSYFTIKMLFVKGDGYNKARDISTLFKSNSLAVSHINDEEIGVLLSIDGQQFINWYEK